MNRLVLVEDIEGSYNAAVALIDELTKASIKHFNHKPNSALIISSYGNKPVKVDVVCIYNPADIKEIEFFSNFILVKQIK
jgi:hypothetical protein